MQSAGAGFVAQPQSDTKPPLMPPTSSAVKRKRTNRPRHHPPPASSAESTTTEEEDMAHCLILLAQGAGSHAAVDSKPPPPPLKTTDRYTSRKYTEAPTTADGVRAGFYVYECKTCNKCFPTFQALGGHRASHKKPRLAADDDTPNAINFITTTNLKQDKPPPPPPSLDQPHRRVDVAAAVFPDVTTSLTLSLNNVISTSGSKLRVHECSICGAEFASGQALGGHMRRHRPLNAPVTAITAPDAKKEGSATINLELDLNLPAPSDEESVSLPPPAVVLGLGQFNDGNKAGLMLTASALVDCHY